MSKRTKRVRVAVGERLQPVGEFVFETDGRRHASMFRYAVEWLEHGRRFAIAPSMPLGEYPFYAAAPRSNPRNALPGPISDSSPDSWGRGLMRRARSGALTELDYLLAVDDRTRQGSLRYLDEDGTPLAHSYPPVPRLNELARLRRLAGAAGSAAPMTASERDELLGSAGSLGGARPKASVHDESGHLTIAKFTSDQDSMPVERAEVATLKLARAAGVKAASARLELAETKRPVALIKRFDRSRRKRLSYLSAQSFLVADTATGAFYSDIADSLRAHAFDPARQMAELHRRILFMILVSNTDDHLKNHGLLHVGEGRWVLSPAFDINPQPFRERQLETGISELSGNTASVEAALEASPFFGVPRDAAAKEVSRITSIIDKQWRAQCLAAGMRAEEVNLYRPAFDHEETRIARRIGARTCSQPKSA